MTTTDMNPPPAAPPSGPTPTDRRPLRRMRRSRTDKVGAGVAGGLGQYFGVDPVLFRVLFATAAFFGGAGILAYLVAWAAIPEEGTEHAAIDDWVSRLRAKRVPFWAIAVAAALVLWLVAFSWWAPGPFVPVVVVVIILVAVFGRKGRAPVTPPVSLEKDAAPASTTGRPRWNDEARQWIAESHAASRARARRAFPVKIATLLTLVAALVTLGLVDGAHGVAVPLYFWFGLGIVGLGLLVGMVLRRTPWSMTPLFVLSIAGVIAFAGSHASLHDGVGRRVWTPTSSIAPTYKLAFGDATLDLRSFSSNGAQTVRIDQAAGQLRIIAPRSMNLVVQANVHFGTVTLDGELPEDGDTGVAVSRTVEPLAGATGPRVTVVVHLADGRVDISRR